MLRIFAPVAIALLLGAPVRGVAGSDAVEVYRPRGRSAESLVEPARALLGGGGDAFADPASGLLVLRGPRPALTSALEGLRKIDVALRTYRVQSTLTTLSELSARGVEAVGWHHGQAGIRVGRIDDPEGLFVRVRSGLTQGQQRLQGEIAVLEGHSAEIWTGTTYPARTRTLRERPDEVRLYETTTLVPVRTGFRVTPRGLGDGSVELEIAPMIEEKVEEDRIASRAAATTVRVRPGEAVVIASSTAREEELAVDPFAYLDRREGASESAMLVRVDVDPRETPPGASAR